MVAVAEIKQQRKLPHQLAKKKKKKQHILFWPKVQAFGRKPVAHSHWHFGRRKGKERCKQKINKILVIGRQREKNPLIFWPVSALVTYSWLILLAKKRVLSQTDAAWGTRVTFDLRLDCTGYHQLVSCFWCWKYSSYLHGVVAFSFILLLDKYLMRFTVGFFHSPESEPCLVNHLSHGRQRVVATPVSGTMSPAERLRSGSESGQNVFWHTPSRFSHRCANPKPNAQKYALRDDREMSAKTM